MAKIAKKIIEGINMKKIIFICPYFGKYPNYFNLTLNSMKYNSSIDWLIITDIKDHYDYPNNVKIIYMTFSELQQKIQRHFNFKISLDTPYKLCDYKCAYGYIFQKYINEYDFWGHCDFDAIYGDFRKYLSEEILNKYEKIFYLGHLSLYKNTFKINTMFMNKIDNIYSDYKKIYTDKQIYAFDELGIVNILNSNKINIYIDFPFADIYTWDRALKTIKSKIDFSSGKMYFELNRKQKNVFYFDNGKLYGIYLNENNSYKIEQKEYMYIHLQKRFMDNYVNNINKFLIIPNKFIDYQEFDRKFIIKNTKDNILYKRYIKTKRSYNKRKDKFNILKLLKKKVLGLR